jgi:aldose 1-epimerase
MSPAHDPSITRAPFGHTPDGSPVEIFTLRNQAGLEARIMNYGGIVTSLKTPDREGRLSDVVLGFDHFVDYLKNGPYFGALIGRYGNRIAAGKFSLNGNTYQLALNNGEHALHGGLKGFDKALWRVAAAAVSRNEPKLVLTYLSPDGEEGYPGNLSVEAVYTLTNHNALKVDFSAQTDERTICNLTHHSYFNLAGQGDILGHLVYINSDKTTPVDSGLIPTGEFADVTGTPFDFRKPTAIGARINDPDKVLRYGSGYDHNWVINKSSGQFGLQARVEEQVTGRVMEVWSNQPGLQFYTGNFFDGTIKGKGGVAYLVRTGFAMEPQHYPDSPNKTNFPSVELQPGQTYHNTIEYKFSVA